MHDIVADAGGRGQGSRGGRAPSGWRLGESLFPPGPTTALLGGAARAGHFRTPANHARLAKEEELASLRGRDDDRRLRAALPAKAKGP